jgi:hypothetical protein
MSNRARLLAITLALTTAAASSASAAVTVPYTDPGWQDFGTTSITGVTGNFLPGWETVAPSPDLGTNLFGVPNQSLSGAPDAAALWMLQVPSGLASNEEAKLSLSGFSVGQTYTLPFFATVLRGGTWYTDNDALDVSIVGATPAAFSTTVLVDPVSDDGMNDWIPQTIVFTATASTVDFTFGGGATGPDAVRFGIDGFTGVKSVPEPASLALLAFGGLALMRRTRSACV